MTDGLGSFRNQRALGVEMEPPLGLDEYQDIARQTDRSQGTGIKGLGFVLLGLFGEVGSLLSELKKKQRDKNAYVAYHDAVLEELGDVLWYLSAAAARARVKMSMLALRATQNLSNWTYHGRPGPLTFAELQDAKGSFAGPITSEDLEKQLLTLAGRVGALVEDYNSGRITANGDVFSANLVEVFRVLVAAADSADVSLELAARRNCAKIVSRWPVEKPPQWGAAFDEGYHVDEQLPRRIEMLFFERNVGGTIYAYQKCCGILIGDRLTDNRAEPDDYRFHDVFHLAYAAKLGWSPVLRALFKNKRKSNRTVDENEDGARAILIEEGVSTWVFNHARKNHLFEHVEALDYSLLKAIGQLVDGYEVAQRPLWQWERAILDGFTVFRQVVANRGGLVIADLDSHTISYRKQE